MGFSGDNGKENGSYYSKIGYIWYIFGVYIYIYIYIYIHTAATMGGYGAESGRARHVGGGEGEGGRGGDGDVSVAAGLILRESTPAEILTLRQARDPLKPTLMFCAKSTQHES